MLLAWFVELSRERTALPLAVEWRQRFDLVAMAMRVARPWRAAVSAKLSVPQVSGVFRPLLLLPAAVLARIPPDQVESIVAHELAHIRRHDYLVNLLQTAVECLLFYHPAVWWLSWKVRQERELCCDAAAVDYCGDSTSYARALLALEETRPALALAASGGGLRDRVANLFGYRPASSFALPALAVVLIAGGVALASQKEAPEPPPPPVAPRIIDGRPSPGMREQIERGVARAQLRKQSQRPQGVGQAGIKAEMKKAEAALAKSSKTFNWLHEDVAYLVSDAERFSFLSLRSGPEREQFIEQFWQRRDPTPGTPANEFKQEHYRRIKYANERFGLDGKPGWRTDRGRVYISLGPPDEIECYPGKQETWKYTVPAGAQPRILRFEGESMRLIVPQPPPPAAPAAPPRVPRPAAGSGPAGKPQPAPAPPPPPPAPQRD